jgi:hypothetical protein
MAEESQNKQNLNEKPYEKIKTDLEEDDKESKITKSDDSEICENKEKNKTRFKPKVKLDMKKQRYPYCLVWTPLPCFTWFFPSIGHVGICTSKGIIRDFAGPYYVSEDDMAFGNPTKYILLDLDSREFDEYDKAIEIGTFDYKQKFYSFCCNNCHSYVARCLNRLKYKGKTSYTMIHVWWMFCIKGRFLSWEKFFQTYIGFIAVLIIGIGLYFLCTM